MLAVAKHEFVADEQGDLALLMDVLSFDTPDEPVLLVSTLEDKAYLKRSTDNVHEILDIDSSMIGKLRKVKHLVVLEVLGETVTHTYSVDVAPLEESADV